MDSPVVVFLGPTLPLEQARDILDAHYAPPAEQGHVVDAIQRLRPRAIVLIDGAFGAVPSVRHKEILWALSQGIAVFGASSIGALRAAELAGLGMRGYGLIYRWYRAVPLADDDEVAVAMAPPELGAQPLGDALIDMRITLRRAERAGIIPAEVRCHLVELARSTHCLERSYAHVLARAREEGPPTLASSLAALEPWIGAHAVSQKQVDAIGLLRIVQARLTQGTLVPGPAPSFEMTEAFIYDLDASGRDAKSLLGSAKEVGTVTHP